jgi:hypothetical protein
MKFEAVKIWSVVLRVVTRCRIIGLMMEAASTSETSVTFYQTTRHIIGDNHPHVVGMAVKTFRRKNPPNHSNLNMEAVLSYEMLMNTNKNTRHRNREEHHLKNFNGSVTNDAFYAYE